MAARATREPVAAARVVVVAAAASDEIELRPLAAELAWSEAALADELAAASAGAPRSWVAREADRGGAALGFISTRLVAGELHILALAVLGSARKQGIARRLVAHAAATARSRSEEPLARILLEVRASNDGARAFYARLGFAETGRRKRYYGDGEDAVLLECEAQGDVG